ncbi:TetR family transcriptional regulator [Luteibacter rhizovicinus]|uniref:TetR family transcriptional regulator n=1 Tax=Luteibacter rhizovicinus TaxID=242606 RepID=A0A4V2W3B8_9GAMM|nr:TetR/AcrR family transcriptional regulator [Luteibacter rhizovicinus]TCV91309.1 TetR family transcriptional regulator [Luteibacter rhizovicinus]
MTSTPVAVAAKPKQERGRQRVAAILEAGAQVFSEKGYDAATMTEIAARAATAIGSMYRFFPSKESLADALLVRYAEHAVAEATALGERAQSLSLEELANALVDFRLSLQSERQFAIGLVDARGGRLENREAFRKAMLRTIAGILRNAVDGLSRTRSEAAAFVLLQMLKGVSEAANEKPGRRAALLTEIRSLTLVYLISLKQPPAA